MGRTGEDGASTRRAGVAVGGAAAALAGALGWGAYSTFGVNHHVPLPPAIDAERRTMDGGAAGRLSYYATDGGAADGGATAVGAWRDSEGDDVPVVLLHSMNAAASSYEMRPLFERLRRGRRVYALDLPGFGFSERADRDYTPDLYAGAIVDFLAHVAPGGACDVVALSVTGEFAGIAAARAPERFRSLALISPTGFTLPGQRRGPTQQRSPSGSNVVSRVLSARLVGQPLFDALVTRPIIGFFLKQSFAGPVDRGLLEYDWITAHQPGARFAPFVFVTGRLFTRDVRERYYDAVTVPALVLHDDAPYGTFDALGPLSARRPNWRGLRIGATRGLPHFELPDATLEALTAFWATCDTAAPAAA